MDSENKEAATILIPFIILILLTGAFSIQGSLEEELI